MKCQQIYLSALYNNALKKRSIIQAAEKLKTKLFFTHLSNVCIVNVSIEGNRLAKTELWNDLHCYKQAHVTLISQSNQSTHATSKKTIPIRLPRG